MRFTFDEIIGQGKAKTVCSTLANYAKESKTCVPHILFSGPSGIGKTSLATAIAETIETEIFTINAATVKDKKQVLKLMERVQERNVVFIDEIHALSKRSVECLYTVMEDFLFFDDSGRKINVPKFTLIGATTELGTLIPPFRNRFQFIAELEPYTNEEIIDICLLIANKSGITLPRNLAGVIANTCRGIPRLVKNRTLWINSYMRANGLKNINEKQILDIIKLQGIDKNGLERLDYDYLRGVNTQTLSVDSISSKLSVDRATIKQSVEPYLLKLDLIKIDKTGRSLTQNGLNLLKEINNGK